MKKISILISFILLIHIPLLAGETSVIPAGQLPIAGGSSNDSGLSAAQSQAQLADTMRLNRFSETDMARIHSVLEDMEGSTLPAEPVINKVYEGIAKGVEPEVIVQAAERVRDRYRIAERQAGEFTSDTAQRTRLREMIASTYAAGMTEPECSRIVSRLQTATRTMDNQTAQELALQTMATARAMLRRGAGPENTSRALDRALAQSYQAGDMVQMRHRFEYRARYGSPDRVAAQFDNEISSGAKAEELGRKANRNGDESGAAANGPEGSGRSGERGDSGNSGNSGDGEGGSSGSTGSGSGGSGSGGSSGGGSEGNQGGSGNSGGSKGDSGGGRRG